MEWKLKHCLDMEAETGTIKLFLPISKRTLEEWALEKGCTQACNPSYLGGWSKRSARGPCESASRVYRRFQAQWSGSSLLHECSWKLRVSNNRKPPLGLSVITDTHILVFFPWNCAYWGPCINSKLEVSFNRFFFIFFVLYMRNIFNTREANLFMLFVTSSESH